ncbi:hypothetical protein [Phenylobacterium sp. J367]|uniref:hypothetical protein n=1 Tax=Phenylobacterium sp. J367 TaxID=2898435 RepID=UPI002150C3C3|nr:hypothetical protein [Phenylobacterium sp. J367]MCR5879437.1 hypothetical protein [Phenylobacterium sp. J367]
MPRSRTDLTSIIARNTPRLASGVSEPLVHFLVVARELCESDLDTLLVMMIIIQRANLHPDFPALDGQAVMEGRIDHLPMLDVNTQSIADSTHIPRETVRRKVAQLVELGWVVREGRNLRYTPEGYRAMEPARAALVRMVARIAETLDANLGDGLDASATRN